MTPREKMLVHVIDQQDTLDNEPELPNAQVMKQLMFERRVEKIVLVTSKN